MIRWAEVMIKATGQRVRYEYQDVWNARQYSFDGGKNWYLSRVFAYHEAEAAGKLVKVKPKKGGRDDEKGPEWGEGSEVGD